MVVPVFLLSFPFFFLSSRFFFISDGIRTELEGVVSLSSRPSLCIVTECSAHRVGFYFINLNVGDVHVKYFARLAKFEANQMPRCLVFSFFNSSLSLFFLFFFFFFFRLSFGRHEDWRFSIFIDFCRWEISGARQNGARSEEFFLRARVARTRIKSIVRAGVFYYSVGEWLLGDSRRIEIERTISIGVENGRVAVIRCLPLCER